MPTSYLPLPLASKTAGENINRPPDPQTWIITGARGAGKTSLCRQIVHEYKQRGISVAGILSHAHLEGGRKTGITLQNLLDDECRLLGSLAPLRNYSLRVGCWYFSEEVLAWGNECLQAAADHDLVVFDECGFLELLYGQGFSAGMDLFDRQSYRLGLVVVRPELSQIAQRRWPHAFVHSVERIPA